MFKSKKREKIREDHLNANNDNLVVYKAPQHPIAEVYRTLRTNIQFTTFDRALKTLSVTSATEGEGKTTTLSNLAVTFAQQSNRVLVIDADLRRPKVHKIFNLENRQGLTEVLVNQADSKELIHSTFVENLFVLPTGVIPPNPSELLGSRRMKDFLALVEKDFDYVLIDTPPVNMVTDGLLIANIVDGLLLVCSSGVVPTEEAQRAKELLTQAKANILGVVLNNVPFDSSKYYYYQNDDIEKAPSA